MDDDAVHGAGYGAVRIPFAQPAFGLEALDGLGIDIDQDPRAFAKFLELRNLMQERSPRRRPVPRTAHRR